MIQANLGKLSTLALLLVLSIPVVTAVARGRNIALHRPYTYSPAANYPLTKDDGDKTQLTDGVRSAARWLWVDKKAVGWGWPPLVTISLDLGGVQPISGASYSTAFGRADVTMPFALYVLVSDDGKDFHLLGDLIAESAENGLPEPGGYKTHVFRASHMLGRGRYVRFVIVPSGTYVMCDEIEVFAGTDGQKDRPRGEVVKDVQKLIASRKLTTVVQGRIAGDLSTLERLDGFSRRRDLWDAIAAMKPVTKIQWRRGLPCNELHRRVWAAHGPWARGQLKGTDERLLVWSQNRWEQVRPFDLPTKQQVASPDIHVRMIDGEYRSAVLNLTNLSDKSAQVELACRLDGGISDDAITLREVVYTEAQSRHVVDHALPQAKRAGDKWRIEVPAGVTRQVWMTFHPKNVKPGEYGGRIDVACGDLGVSRSVPARLTVYPFTFPAKPALMTHMWDYCHPGGAIRHENTWKAAIGLMKEYFIDVPFMAPAAIPWPKLGEQVDKAGNIIAKLDWSAIDEWIEQWGKDARLFVLYLGEPSTVPRSRFPLDSAAGQNEINGFFALLVERFERRGISADRIVLLPRDEPHEPTKDKSIIAWARALHKANPKLRVLTDPIWKDPYKATQEMFTVSDIVCPNRSHYGYGVGENKRFAAFYEKVRQSGKPLWVHACGSPARAADPYSYFLAQGWFCFRHSIIGNSFWALTDVRHKPFGKVGSWNDFAGTTNFSILFWDGSGVTPSKQMEAMREAAEDYEYLTMLKKAIDSAPATKAAGARATLQRVLKQVRANGDRAAPDRARIEVLEELVRLTREGR